MKYLSILCTLFWRAEHENFALMTRVAGEFGDPKQKETMKMVSSDVNFVFSQAYDIGDNSISMEQESTEMPSLKEIVAKETSELLEQKKRLSVRDLTKRFEQGLSEASKLSNEVLFPLTMVTATNCFLNNIPIIC